MSLMSQLQTFDGKHIDTLEKVAEQVTPDNALIEELCEITKQKEAKLQTATTWLLKRFQERGVVYAPSQIETILELFEYINHWEAKLHLLQILPALDIPSQQKERLYQTLIGYLQDNKKFVRAWSYNGLALLADKFPKYRPEVIRRLKDGQQEESASIKARIRNMAKDLSWVTL